MFNNKQNLPHRIGATKNRRSGSGKSFKLSRLIPSIPNGGSILLGFIAGVAITSLLFWYFSTSEITLRIPSKATQEIDNQNMAQQSEDESVSENAAKETTADTSTQAANQEPRFDFYTELTQNDNVNQHIPAKPKILDLKSNVKPINKYYVQVASFQHRSDADALKARLTLNGLEAKLQLVKLDDGKIWHRVIMGPFKNEAQAYSQKQALKSLEIDKALVLKQTD